MQTDVLITWLCRKVCGRLRPHRVVLDGRGGYRLRCQGCRQEWTPAVLHALVQGGDLGCEHNGPFASAVLVPTTRVNCGLCRVLTERVHARLPTPTVLCRRCRKIAPQQRDVAVAVDGHDWTVTTCTSCGHRREEMGPLHLGSTTGTRCGLRRARRVEAAPRFADCPACLDTLPLAHESEGPTPVMGCRACSPLRQPQQRLHDVFRAGEVTVLRCATCGERHVGPALRHWRAAGEAGACTGRWPQGSARRSTRVTCGECLRWLLSQALVTPDWRPPQAIAEDHYAR